MQSRPVTNDLASWHCVESHHDFVIATSGAILTVVWLGETTLAGTERLHIAIREFAVTHPRGIGLLTIVGARAPLPAPAVRKELAQMLAEGRYFIKCSAILIEGSGFRASAVRSVVTGLTLLAQQPYPHRVCDVDETVQLFSRHLPSFTSEVISQSALRVAIDQLRQLVQG